MVPRPKSNHPTMTISDRAKQFAPFSALSGLDKALHSKEVIKVDKPILSEESLAELDIKLHSLCKGKIAHVIYFKNGEYIKISGMVAKIEQTSRIIQIVNSRINFDDILDICLEDE